MRRPTSSRLARMVPIAGAVIARDRRAGARPGRMGSACRRSSAPTLAITALWSIVAGALHEDGLADVADGFGGGATRERKLEIMRDSRIGAFGAAALALSLILRVAALGALLERGIGEAVGRAGARRRRLARLRPAPARPARPRPHGWPWRRRRTSGQPGGARAAGLVALIVAVALGLRALGFWRAILGLGAGAARRLGDDRGSRGVRSAARPATSPARRSSLPKLPVSAAFSSDAPPLK